MCSSTVREQFLGVTKDNQLYHCQLENRVQSSGESNLGMYMAETSDERLALES